MAEVDPVRSCCGQRHSGLQCPDGLVMCCLCFDRVPVEQLAVDSIDMSRVDVCVPCDEADKRAVEARVLKGQSGPPQSGPFNGWGS